MSTYTISTKVSPDCVSMISLTLFEEGSGNDSFNNILIDECLGNFMQSKKLRKLNYFYQQRQFGRDSSFDFNIWSSSTYSQHDLYSFTLCPKYACDKEQVSTFETQMFTLDARTGRVIELKDILDPSKKDSLASYMYKIVTMYRVRSLPTCGLLSYNPNQVSTNNAASTGTDIITYNKGLTHKFYLSEDKIHLFNSVKHRDYDYDDVEVALPFNKIKYFLLPEWSKRLGIE
jgi:hypothetical protein